MTTSPVTTAAPALAAVATSSGSGRATAAASCGRRVPTIAPPSAKAANAPMAIDSGTAPTMRGSHGVAAVTATRPSPTTSSGRPPGSATSGSTSRGTMTSVMARRAR